MKITDVKVALIKYPLPDKLYKGSERSTVEGKLVIIEVLTDEGLFGVGETWYRGQDLAYYEAFLNRFLKGKNPHNISEIITVIRSQFDLFDERDLGSVEVALWDIVGKASDTSVHELLGRHRETIRAYLSMASHLTAEEKGRRVDEIVGYSEQGFKAIKLRIGSQNPKKVLEYIAAIKEALGEKIEIAVDANQDQALGDIAWSYETALTMAKELDNMGIIFLEEPLNTKRLKEIADISSNVRIPIAGGERETCIFGFKEFVENDVYDIVQPDIVMSGGISQVLNIAKMASHHQKLCIPHSWCHGISLAATLQAIGAMEKCGYVEFPFDKSWPIERRDVILEEPISINKDGCVKIPDEPGIGVRVKKEIVDRLAEGQKIISVNY